VGGGVIDASLDEKGKWKSSDGQAKVKIKKSSKDDTWKLSATRKKSDLKDTLSGEGLIDEDNPKPGKSVTLDVCITAAGQNHLRSVSLSYKSKLGKSGKAK
jgi:hypothetical protein